jgi:hypothetical protein
MISRVELWSISSRVFDMFGADIECNVVSQRPDELARLNIAYDRWREEWLNMLSFKDQPTGSSRRAFDLYFYSAKLYLFSHVFRGSPSQLHNTKPPAEPDTHVNTFVDGAVKSALSIIRCIVDELDDAKNQKSWLEKLPPYIGTIVAFACVCLVRVSRQQIPLQCDMRGEDIPGYLHRLVQALRLSPVMDQPVHPLVSIVRSLETATAPMIARQEYNHDPSTWNEIRDLDLDIDLGVFDMFTNDAVNGCDESHGVSFSEV